MESAQRAVGCLLTHEAPVGTVMFLGYNQSLALSGSIPRTLAARLRVFFGRAVAGRCMTRATAVRAALKSAHSACRWGSARGLLPRWGAGVMMTFAASCRRAAGEASRVRGPVRSAQSSLLRSPRSRAKRRTPSRWPGAFLALRRAQAAQGAMRTPNGFLGAVAGGWRRSRLALRGG